MNELNVFIRDIVSQAGFSPALALNDEQFEHVYSFVTRDLSKTEQDVQNKDQELKQMYAFDRFWNVRWAIVMIFQLIS